ncbi:hypothetical protein AWB68_06944 [Caballeronia choica]|uniref:Uncharacterized protein n=1 Tax=Caballeronia choica TaxID=326476 RepID=A0A158KSV8_9BURK|nr:hypothetical protein [Caballeronia choica]SAL83521.1 hypothetical protein AWB68_06944 [Caballeronia choica]
MTWDMRLDPFGNLLPGAPYDDPPGMDPAEQEFLLSMFDTPITIHRSFVEVRESRRICASDRSGNA